MIRRPERLRELSEQRRLNPSPEPQAIPAPPEVVLDEAAAVRQMLGSGGWAVIQKRLVAKNSALWAEFKNPHLAPLQAESLRLQAIKYSGIEDVIEEILRQAEQIQRSTT